MATAKTTSQKSSASRKKAPAKGILTKAKDAIVEAFNTVVDGAAAGAADGVAAAIGKNMGSGDPAKAPGAKTSKPVRGNGTSAKDTKARSKPATSGGKSAAAKSKTASASKAAGNGGAKKTAAKGSTAKAKTTKPAAKSSSGKKAPASAK